MKANYILSLSAIVLSITVYGQDNAGIFSGKVTYQEKMKFEIKLEGDAVQFANDLPKEQVNSKVLYFNQDFSLYQADDSKKEEENPGQEHGIVRIRMIGGGETDRTFCDLKEKKKTEQKEFMTRQFLVEGDLKPSDWKITGNYLKILGYNCLEATSGDSIRNVKAWFASSIPVSSGPAGYSGLPGLILKVDIDNGKRIITASAINNNGDVSGNLIKPKDGKKVTEDEFKKIVDDKMKEMGHEEGQGGNHVIIRIKN